MAKDKECSMEEIDKFVNSYILSDEFSKKILESESRSICDYIELFELGLKKYANSPKNLKDSLESPVKIDSSLIDRIVNYKG